MTTYHPGDVLLVRFPYVSGTRQSLRPALVVLDAGDSDVLLAKITTQRHGSRHDLVIVDWKGAGLIAPSQARLHKMATIEKSLIDRSLGRLQAIDRQQVAAVFSAMFANW